MNDRSIILIDAIGLGESISLGACAEFIHARFSSKSNIAHYYLVHTDLHNLFFFSYLNVAITKKKSKLCYPLHLSLKLYPLCVYLWSLLNYCYLPMCTLHWDYEFYQMNFPNPRYDMCRRRKGGRCTKGTAGNVTVYFADGKLLCRRAPPSWRRALENFLPHQKNTKCLLFIT